MIICLDGGVGRSSLCHYRLFLHAVPISDKVRKRPAGRCNDSGRASPVVARSRRQKLRWRGYTSMAEEFATPKDEIHCRGGARTAPTGDFHGKACGSLAPPVPAVIMRKIHLILLVLLSGLCLACQPDPTKARLERVLTASWQSYCRHFITERRPGHHPGRRRRHHLRGPGLRPAPGGVGRR